MYLVITWPHFTARLFRKILDKQAKIPSVYAQDMNLVRKKY